MTTRKTIWATPEYTLHAPTIEIYAMYRHPDGDMSADPQMPDGSFRDTPDTWDVLVRYSGGDPLAEVEDLLSYEEALQAAKNLQTIFKHSNIEDCIP